MTFRTVFDTYLIVKHFVEICGLSICGFILTYLRTITPEKFAHLRKRYEPEFADRILYTVHRSIYDIHETKLFTLRPTSSRDHD